MESDKNLKLIFVLKVGYNIKDEGLYEFIFSKDETNIDVETWCWDLAPACDNALPPTEDYYDTVISLKTKSFNLQCLMEDVTNPYIFGYHTINALAYETELISDDDNGFNQYEKMMEGEDVPLLVFHYGMTLARIKDLLYARKSKLFYLNQKISALT